jgi:hypothetical protein
MKEQPFHFNTPITICHQLRRLSENWWLYPRLGFAIAWG